MRSLFLFVVFLVLVILVLFGLWYPRLGVSAVVFSLCSSDNTDNHLNLQDLISVDHGNSSHYKSLVYAQHPTNWSHPSPCQDCPSTFPRVLLLGDSVDRFLVEDFCNLQSQQQPNRVLDYDWSSHFFSYKHEISGSRVCGTFTHGALGFLHLYGSAETGPYLHGHSNCAEDPFTDTSIRICKGLEVFQDTVGTPSWIVYQTLLWDIYFTRTEVHKKNSMMDQLALQYRVNIESRLQDIKRCKNPCSQVALRTVPHMQWGGEILLVFNGILRQIAVEQALPLLDYDYMAWNLSYATDESALFKDSMHPNQEVSATFAMELLSELSSMSRIKGCG